KRCCGGNSRRNAAASRRRAKRMQGSSKASSFTYVVRGLWSVVRSQESRTTDHGLLGELPQEHLQAVAELLVHAERRRRLVAAVNHTVFAARVLSIAVAVPVRIFQQSPKRRMVLVGDEIARPLPALDVAGRVAPRRARQLALAAQEFQVNRRRSQ